MIIYGIIHVPPCLPLYSNDIGAAGPDLQRQPLSDVQKSFLGHFFDTFCGTYFFWDICFLLFRHFLHLLTLFWDIRLHFFVTRFWGTVFGNFLGIFFGTFLGPFFGILFWDILVCLGLFQITIEWF